MGCAGGLGRLPSPLAQEHRGSRKQRTGRDRTDSFSEKTGRGTLFFLRDLTFVLEGLTFRFSKKLSEFKTGILSSAKQSALAPEPRVSCSGKWHAPGHKTEQDLTEL